MGKNKILLIDADSTIPNIALCKLSAFYKESGYSVDFIKLNIPYYPSRKKKVHYIDTACYDKAFCSIVFDGNAQYIKGENIEFGGSGFDLKKKLPEEIEDFALDYSIYPENDTSYGFITRGCIRNCEFCKVPEKEGKIRIVNSIDNIAKHKKVKFLDNNILAHKDHSAILKELVNKQIKCQFNQGLDIRLVNKENSRLLSQMNYLGEYIFAFDDFKYKHIIEEKLELLDWRKDWQLKFFIYVNPKMMPYEISSRTEWLRGQKILPYIMRDISCWDSENKDYYTDLAAYGNQPSLFKYMTFDKFLLKRHPKNIDRVRRSAIMYYAEIKDTIAM